MRILVVNPYGRHGQYSGPCVLMERLFSTLAAASEVVVLGGKGAAPTQGYAWARMTVGLCENQSLGGLRQLNWCIRTFVWLLARGRQFDIVHFHGCYLFNIIPALALSLHGVPYALIALAADAELSRSSRVARIPPLAALRRSIVANAAVAYALADEIRTEFKSIGLRVERIQPLGNPVDVEKFRPITAPDDDPRVGSRIVVFVGKVGRRKRATMVLEAVAMLRERGHAAGALFVGPFESRAFEGEFRARTRLLGLEGVVTVTGHVEDVSAYLRSNVSLFVLPSALEGLPGALVEALAAGLPCVVTDVGSMGEVVRAANSGEVVEPDAAKIADFAVRAWADPHQWRMWSTSARDFAVQHFSREHVAEQYLIGLQLARLQSVEPR